MLRLDRIATTQIHSVVLEPDLPPSLLYKSLLYNSLKKRRFSIGGPVDSTIKLARACPLMVVCGAKLIHNSLNLMTHLSILPETSNICKKCFNG